MSLDGVTGCRKDTSIITLDYGLTIASALRHLSGPLSGRLNMGMIQFYALG